MPDMPRQHPTRRSVWERHRAPDIRERSKATHLMDATAMLPGRTTLWGILSLLLSGLLLSHASGQELVLYGTARR